MMGTLNGQYLLSIWVLLGTIAVVIYCFLFNIALKSDRPTKNIIVVIIIGLFSVPLLCLGHFLLVLLLVSFSIPFIARKKAISFDDEAQPDDVKLRLAKELKIKASENLDDHALVSDLRIPFPEVEFVVRIISHGYEIDPHLITISNSSTIEQLAQQISKYYTQKRNAD